jgi:zinc transporter 1/2/3
MFYICFIFSFLLEMIFSDGKTRVIAYILEFGIAVHSIIIGLALGCQTEASEIMVLMLALCFHQTFEGFALGVSVVQAQLSFFKNCIMVAIFSLTTPIGIAIGIIITSAQQADSNTLTLLQVLMSAIN